MGVFVLNTKGAGPSEWGLEARRQDPTAPLMGSNRAGSWGPEPLPHQELLFSSPGMVGPVEHTFGLWSWAGQGKFGGEGPSPTQSSSVTLGRLLTTSVLGTFI